MSQENVEIMRRVYEAAGSRNSEAVFALYDPRGAADHQSRHGDSPR